jgi:PAS domain S-box-containing protein
METVKSSIDLVKEIEQLRLQLEEANDTIEAIRTGQVDGIVVKGKHGPELYTLTSADQSYRVFIEKMTEGAVTLDKNKTILYSNTRFASIVNMPLSQVIGLSFSAFVEPQCQELFDACFERGFTEDWKEELMLSGQERSTPCQLSFTSLEIDNVVSLSILITDLTNLKENQEQLRLKNEQLQETNKALELSNIDLQQFAYVASHDLQEPLRKIQTFTHLINEQHHQELTPRSRQYLGKILSSANRMKTLIIDILKYSQIASVDLKFERVDLQQIITDLLEDFELAITQKKASVTFSELPVLEGIAAEIRQVFHNLISNALKFSKPEEAPRIIIRARRVKERAFDSARDRHGSYYEISVEDNGIGFNQEYSKQIFTLFQRLNSWDKYEGTGIGLAITKKIIDRHDGLIRAQSAEGKGAEFIMIFPITQKVNDSEPKI